MYMYVPEKNKVVVLWKSRCVMTLIQGHASKVSVNFVEIVFVWLVIFTGFVAFNAPHEVYYSDPQHYLVIHVTKGNSYQWITNTVDYEKLIPQKLLQLDT